MLKYLTTSLSVIFILCITSSPSIKAQAYFDTTWTAQLDGDRVPDSIHYMHEYAGGGYFQTATVDFSSRRKSIDLSRSRYFSQLTSFVELPRGTNISNNQAWVKEIKGNFTFEQRPGNKPEGSLAWLMDAYFSHQKVNHQILEEVYTYTPIWQSGKPTLPESYSITIGHDTLTKLLTAWYNTYQELNQPLPTKTWFNYHGGIHSDRHSGLRDQKALELLISTPEFKLYGTAHGLVYVKDNRHSWCFVSESITHGPTKLRWKSIEKVAHWEGLIFLIQNGGGFSKNLWVIDPDHGKAGMVDRTIAMVSDDGGGDAALDQIVIRNDHLILPGWIRADRPIESIDLRALKKDLAAF